MKEIPSLTEQRVFVRSPDTERIVDVPKGIGDEMDNWDFEDAVTVERVTTTGICDRF